MVVKCNYIPSLVVIEVLWYKVTTGCLVTGEDVIKMIFAMAGKFEYETEFIYMNKYSEHWCIRRWETKDLQLGPMARVAEAP